MFKSILKATACLLAGVAMTSLGGCGTLAMAGVKAVSTMAVQARGPVRVAFEQEEVGPSLAAELGSAKSVAIWTAPDPGGVAIAESLASSGAFERVVSPAAVLEALQKSGGGFTRAGLMESERMAATAKLAAALGVDAVLTFDLTGQNHDIGRLTLIQTTTTRARAAWFDQSANAVVWSADLKIKAQQANNRLAPNEAMSAVGADLVARLAKLREAPGA